MVLTTLSADGRVAIPEDLRRAACLSEGDKLSAEMTSSGILLRPVGKQDPDQWWYWTDEWQAGEREIDEDHAAGKRGPVFASGTEFLEALHEVQTSAATSTDTAI